MRRKFVRPQSAGVSLFPFLAVLICTMGALIVLLVLTVHQARVHANGHPDEADAEVDPAAAAEREAEARRRRELREAHSDQSWRREVLAESRETKTAEVARARDELSHLEQHIRELKDKWELLKRQAQDLQQAVNEKSTDAAATDERRQQLDAEVERARRELDDARDQLAQRPPAFAILPFEGNSGTRRRPIYVECTADAVILHPEGIRLTAKDFEGPLTSGNPFDAALRAIRDHWIRVEGPNERTNPYPLLVVRPSGVVAYSKARAAMQGWEDEFGYELIDENMQLAFPPADPVLAERLKQTIEDARRRQQARLAAMPSATRMRGGLVASADGGFRAVEGSSRGSRGYAGAGSGSSSRGGAGSGDGSTFGDSSVPGGTSLGGSTGGESGDTSFGGSPLRASGGTNDGADANGFGGTGGFGVGQGGDGSGSGSSNDPRNVFGGSSPNDPSNSNPSATPNMNGTAGSTNSTPGSGQRGAPAGAASTGAPGMAGNPAASGGTGGMNSSGQASGGFNTAESQSNPTGGSPGFSASNNTSAAGSSSMNGSGAGSLAQARGENWGLPNAAPGLVAVTRQVHVTVLPDRLVLVPGPGENFRPIVTMVEGPLNGSIDGFVNHIWKRIKGWGIAVPGGYWKPVLMVDVGPGAESRFNELAGLLRDSGLDVQRKGN